MKNSIKPVAVSLGAAVLLGLSATSGAAPAEANPFASQQLNGGYQVLAEGKCGEGKCGGSAKSSGEGKCGEGKCGGSAKSSGEGKCGEGKCGGSAKSSGEGKCGEGKCGGSK